MEKTREEIQKLNVEEARQRKALEDYMIGLEVG